MESKTSALSGGPLCWAPACPLSVLLGKCLLLSVLICQQNRRVISFFNAGGSRGVTGAFGGGSSGWFSPASAQSKHLATGLCYGLVDLKPSHRCLHRGGWLCYSPRRAAVLQGAGLPRRVLVFPYPALHPRKFFWWERWRSDHTGRQVGLQNGMTTAKHKLGYIPSCCCTIAPCFWLEGAGASLQLCSGLSEPWSFSVLVLFLPSTVV